MRNYRIIAASVAPKHLDAALGILFMVGLTTVHQHRRRNGIDLEAQIPNSASNASFLKKIRSFQVPGKPLFKRLRGLTVKKGAWASDYQKYLKPFQLFAGSDIDKNILIDPSGKIPAVKRAGTLYIEASLAFGTGTHPTTQLAARLVRNATLDLRRPKVLDLGCGTGILAMLAKHWGSGETWAVDNDPEALMICRQNFRQNRIGGIKLKLDLGKNAPRFDLIVANITADVLLKLRPLILRHLKPKGRLILTGLLYRDVSEIESAFAKFPKKTRLNRRGWAALLLQ